MSHRRAPVLVTPLVFKAPDTPFRVYALSRVNMVPLELNVRLLLMLTGVTILVLHVLPSPLTGPCYMLPARLLTLPLSALFVLHSRDTKVYGRPLQASVQAFPGSPFPRLPTLLTAMNLLLRTHRRPHPPIRLPPQQTVTRHRHSGTLQVPLPMAMFP